MEKLGEGGFGIVFKAFDKRLFKFKALKFSKVKDESSLSEAKYEDYLMTYINDIRLKFKNENLLNYYGLFRKPNGEYIIEMESGERNLREILKIRSRSPENNYKIEEALQIMLCLVEEFNFLQTHGVANRDVKIENILLVPQDEKNELYYYKISDFGIGCILPPNTTKISVDQIKGCTKKYVAPEVWAMFNGNSNDTEYDPFKADVYSLGLLFLDILGISSNDFFSKDNAKIEETTNILIFPGMKELINEMLEEKIEKRLSFSEVITKIEEIVTNSKVSLRFPANEKHFISEFEEWKTKKMDANERLEALFKLYEDYVKIEQYKNMEEILEKCKNLLNYYDHQKNVDDQSQDQKLVVFQKYVMRYYKEMATLNRRLYSDYKEAFFWDEQYFKLSLCLNNNDESRKFTT